MSLPVLLRNTTPLPKKIRVCRECKQTFVTPETLRKHRRIDGNCRSPEQLKAVGFVETPKGWKMTITPPNSNR